MIIPKTLELMLFKLTPKLPVNIYPGIPWKHFCLSYTARQLPDKPGQNAKVPPWVFKWICCHRSSSGGYWPIIMIILYELSNDPVTLWQSSPLPRRERFCPNVSGSLPSLCQSCRVSAEKQNTSSPIFQMEKPCHSCFQFVAQRSRSFHRFLESGQCMINIVKMIMIIQWSVWSGIDGFSKLLPIGILESLHSIHQTWKWH